MQQNNSYVQEFLLRNPHITENELIFMARNPSSPTQTVLTIARHEGWMQVDAIRTAIVGNPKTPPPIALNLIAMMSEPDLLKTYETGSVAPSIRNAVKREMAKRGIRPRRLPVEED